jgi:hypothetical protein
MIMNLRIILISSLLVCGAISGYAQRLGLKNNLLYDVALTPNLGMEFGLGRKTTLDISANYNPFRLSDHKQYKHWLVQPELRFWTCERFNGFFWGIHALGGEASVARIKLPFGIYKQLRDYRYEGWFYGGGAVIGYQWILGRRWNLEAALGVGYMRVHYDKYPCPGCGDKLSSGQKNYLGPTKAAISLIYLIK